MEINIDNKKIKKQEGRKTSSRRHSRIESGKKKRMQSYDEDGKLIYEWDYLVGIKWKGKGKEYYDNGKLKFEGEYLNGKRWNGKGFNIDGNKISFPFILNPFPFHFFPFKYSPSNTNLPL